MSLDAERLYNLLPAIYRIRDAEQGGPLRALLAVIAEQVAVLEDDLARRNDDQFIETCAEWVVPYIGDLVGVRAPPADAATPGGTRAEVANAIGHRRRKGTAAMLEQLARDVTGWEARVVEFFGHLARTPHLNHPRPGSRYALELRDPGPLERVQTPFDRTAHTADVRRIAGGRGRYNIPNLGIFLWRLRPHRLTDSPAVKASRRVGDRRYLFSPLGHDTPLWNLPQTEEEVTHLAEPLNVPEPIGRRALHASPGAYYGPGKSLVLKVDGREVGVEQIVACDLSDRPRAGGTSGRTGRRTAGTPSTPCGAGWPCPATCPHRPPSR